MAKYKWYVECSKCGYQSISVSESIPDIAHACPKCGEYRLHHKGKEPILENKKSNDLLKNAVLFGTGYAVGKNVSQNNQSYSRPQREYSQEEVNYRKEKRGRVFAWVILVFSIATFFTEGFLPGIVLLVAAIVQFLRSHLRSWVKNILLIVLLIIYGSII